MTESPTHPPHLPAPPPNTGAPSPVDRPAPHTPESIPGTLVLIGGGGHAIVVAESARRAGWTIAGFLDDNPAINLALAGINAPHLGPLEPGTIRRAAALGRFIIAVGDLAARAAILERIAPEVDPANWATIIDPSSVLSPSASIAGGVYIGARTVINGRTEVAPHAIINTGAIIEHDASIGAGAHIAPGAILGGAVTIGDEALVGLGAKVLPGMIIGPRAIIGAGAVVNREIEAGATASGVPARPLGAHHPS